MESDALCKKTDHNMYELCIISEFHRCCMPFHNSQICTSVIHITQKHHVSVDMKIESRNLIFLVVGRWAVIYFWCWAIEANKMCKNFLMLEGLVAHPFSLCNKSMDMVLLHPHVFNCDEWSWLSLREGNFWSTFSCITNSIFKLVMIFFCEEL